METYEKAECFTSNFIVLTVPMRNGNYRNIFSKILCTHRVLTVPMRNGNYRLKKLSHQTIYSSYRTYEEWKRIITDAEGRTFQSSYRTYEEWKPFLIPSIYRLCQRSYRTYEEWKQMYSIHRHERIKVLTVPMRNGNLPDSLTSSSSNFCSYRTYEEWKHWIIW